jgi:hypothetical protein
MGKKTISKNKSEEHDSFSLLTDFDIHLFRSGKHFKLYGLLMPEVFLLLVILISGIPTITNYLHGGMNPVFGRVSFPALEKEKSTNMQSTPIPGNILRRPILLLFILRLLPIRHQSSGIMITPGVTVIGFQKGRRQVANPSLTRYMRFMPVVGSASWKTETVH